MPDIKDIQKEYEELLQKLTDPEISSNWEKVDEPRSSPRFTNARVFEELIKRKNFLEKIIDKSKEIKEIKNQIEENKAILNSQENQELSSMAETEIINLQERMKVLEKELAASLEASPPSEGEVRQSFGNASAGRENSSMVIVEIRAGTGGEEAALFARDILKMYSKYAESQSWRQNILDSHPTELGGFKEVIFELENGDVYSKMKYEAGVHRVQRIPETEKGGRIHTSTVSVAVLPKPKSAQIKINPQDLKVDFYRASGPGGQYVQKRETAVRITHLPTGLVATSQTERNQLQNRENALKILEAKILEKKQIAEEEKIAGKRKTQIGWAKRAEKIRTYNFLQDRITDHRIKKSWKKLEKILNGGLGPIISALQKFQAQA